MAMEALAFLQNRVAGLETELRLKQEELDMAHRTTYYMLQQLAARPQQHEAEIAEHRNRLDQALEELETFRIRHRAVRKIEKSDRFLAQLLTERQYLRSLPCNANAADHAQPQGAAPHAAQGRGTADAPDLLAGDDNLPGNLAAPIPSMTLANDSPYKNVTLRSADTDADSPYSTEASQSVEAGKRGHKHRYSDDESLVRKQADDGPDGDSENGETSGQATTGRKKTTGRGRWVLETLHGAGCGYGDGFPLPESKRREVGPQIWQQEWLNARGDYHKSDQHEHRDPRPFYRGPRVSPAPADRRTGFQPGRMNSHLSKKTSDHDDPFQGTPGHRGCGVGRPSPERGLAVNEVGELFYKPEPGERNVFRTIIITGLYPKLSLAEILRKIRGGLVVTMNMATTVANATGSASITFLHEDSARAFIHYCKDDRHLRFRGRPAQVRMLESATFPMTEELKQHIAAGGATRCLRIAVYSRYMRLASVVRAVTPRNQCSNGLVNAWEDGRDEAGKPTFCLQFRSVDTAVRAKAMMREAFGPYDYAVKFDEDPCKEPPAYGYGYAAEPALADARAPAFASADE
ncbi:T-complex protein 1 subunit beta [Elasticomyces elasticus]|nr:T-complex protein 1 subunit beta [Elasticomyces elasticus]